MALTDVLERLYARRRFGIKPGVDRVASLLSRLGNPEKQFRTIHVVGTNGKGSTSAFLSSILHHGGHSVAQFSSPHLIRFTERFRINGVEYSPEKLTDTLDIVLKAAPDEATFFEITTALAAYIFSEERVEFAVMEAGMGGRSDATAALSGEMTLLTPIDLDHTDYLGTTPEEIAREKAGIIRPDTVVVTAEQAGSVLRVIEEQCAACSSLLKAAGRDFRSEWLGNGTFDYHGIQGTLAHLISGLPGQYQSRNAAVALAAAGMLAAGGLSMPADSYRAGVAAARWPGRMELVSGSPRLLLDGAHNPAGAAALAEALGGYSFRRLLMVTGVCDDKDMELIYAPLLPLADAVYTVTPAVERGLPDESLASFFRTQGKTAQPCGSVSAAISAARRAAGADDLILVCGSLFVVGEAKAWLEQAEFAGIRG